MPRERRPISDPVLPSQGGRMTAADPGKRAKEETVQRRAHEIFERRGNKQGFDLQDWLDAEAELCAEGLRAEALKITGS